MLRFITLCVLFLSCGRGVADAPARVDVDEAPTFIAPLPATPCEVTQLGQVEQLFAHQRGLTAVTQEDGLVESVGAGCALTTTRREPLGQVFDVDGEGRVYVRPLPAVRERAGLDPSIDLIARVDATGAAQTVVAAGRGVWSFGASPSGQTMWVSACGPTGVLAVSDRSPVMPEPASDWESLGGVLTDDAVFWSLRRSRCQGDTCEASLIRSTPQSEEQVAELGRLPFSLHLSRCGEGPCVWTETMLWRFESTGALHLQRSAEGLGAGPYERLAWATGGGAGLYVRFESRDHPSRVLFLPTDASR